MNKLNINQLFNNNRQIILPIIINILPLLVASQTVTSKLNSIPNKITHSFGLQFNNCMYDKGKFYDQTESKFKLYPIYSYGSEFLFNYNLTHSSGFGLSIDLLAGDMAFGIKYIPYSNSFYRKINDITYENCLTQFK